MKILVVSDTHGNLKNIEFALKNFPHEKVFFLGDGYKDLKNFGDEEIYAVKGNCDFFVTADEDEVLKIEGYKILLTHGHTYGVKYTLSALTEKAEKEKFDLVCFGHTHKFFNLEKNGVTYLNPGSLGAMCENSFAILNIEKNSIKITQIPVAKF